MYIDGFLLAVPAQNKKAYEDQARQFWDVIKDYGAVSMQENWGDDIPEGKVNSFHTAVLRKDDEVVVFSWTIWPDKKTRDEGWQKMMADERMAGMKPESMPFDGQRIMYGGFTPLVAVTA